MIFGLQLNDLRFALTVPVCLELALTHAVLKTGDSKIIFNPLNQINMTFMSYTVSAMGASKIAL
jgi:hypothetical protein